MLGNLSLRLKKYAPDCVDLRGLTDDPLKAAYLSPEQKFLLDVDLDKCLGLHGAAFSCAATGAHPFVRTLRAYAAGLCKDYAGSDLREFYDRFQPESAAQALGLSGDDMHPELSARSAFASTLPWDFLSPQENENVLKSICNQDYADNGFALTADAGWKAWGPVSDEAGEAEFARLLHVFNSLQASGYHRHSALDGDIEGQLLAHGSDYRVMISRGQHRIAALAAVGAGSAPIRLLPKTISRADVRLWPNVERGFFTVEQALAVFDRVFEGRQPYAPQASPDLSKKRA